MSYNAAVLKVMIASPGDVAAERHAVREVLQEWNFMHSEDKGLVLLPIGWETHSTPEMGSRPQEIINRQVLANCDLLVGIFWTRIGSPTGKAESGTVEEIDEHCNAGKPAMLYFSSAPTPPESIEPQQYATLKAFKEECRKRNLVESYKSVGEFREKFARQLSQTINRAFPAKNGSNTLTVAGLPRQEASVRLGNEAKALLLEAAADPHGIVLRLHDSTGLGIQTNGKRLSETRNPRSEARWEKAIQELEALGLLTSKSYKREVFDVTDEGYRAADAFAAGEPKSPPHGE
jgi:hypothetical protein